MTETLLKKIGERIMKRRLELGFSQTNLAKALRSTKQNISKIETGQVTSLNNDKNLLFLKQLAGILNCTLDYLQCKVDDLRGFETREVAINEFAAISGLSIEKISHELALIEKNENFPSRAMSHPYRCVGETNGDLIHYNLQNLQNGAYSEYDGLIKFEDLTIDIAHSFSHGPFSLLAKLQILFKKINITEDAKLLEYFLNHLPDIDHEFLHNCIHINTEASSKNETPKKFKRLKCLANYFTEQESPHGKIQI